VDNLYSGNLAQLCPVGAITDVDFRFQTRSWFLEEEESICPLCSRGCRIAVQSHRGFSRFQLPKRVYRIKAVDNPAVNGPWICDLGRYGYSYLDSARISRIESRDGAQSDWSSAVAWLRERILRLKHRNRSDRISILLNSWLTNEEFFLAKKIFRDELGITQTFFADPAPGEGDNLLLTAERSPNRRGALELGWEPRPIDMDVLSQRTDLLLVFGPYFEAGFSLSDIAGCLENIENTVLCTPCQGELNSLVDLVLPTVYIAEKSGSVTNVDGIVQHFPAALPVLGQARAEWSLLKDLGKELALNFKYYSLLDTPENVYREMISEIPFFEKNGE
jgi:NADH-quinone oxidoreductase subunit G